MCVSLSLCVYVVLLHISHTQISSNSRALCDPSSAQAASDSQHLVSELGCSPSRCRPPFELVDHNFLFSVFQFLEETVKREEEEEGLHLTALDHYCLV